MNSRSKLFYGWYILAAIGVMRVLCSLLMLRYESVASFYVFSLAFGLTYLVTGPLTPILASKLFGVFHVGFISGLLTTVHHIGGGLWTYLGGWIFDQTGSYRLAFILSAVISLIAASCAALVSERRQVSSSRNRSKWPSKGKA